MSECMIHPIGPIHVIIEQLHMLCAPISAGYEFDRFLSIFPIFAMI